MNARVVIVGTGGTIAGRGASAAHTATYDCSVETVDDLLDALPGARDLADIQTAQLFQTGSENFGNEELLGLARHVRALLKRDDIDGVVVTHGTDTIDETAYFLHLVVPSAKPVVVVGAMRPASALSADGPLNLYNAIVVASSAASRGKGTLVVSNDEIHSARDVVKTSTFKQEAFRSTFGPLGYVVEGRARFYRLVARRHTVESEWSIDTIQTLPEVAIVYAHGGINRTVVEHMACSDVDAIVYAGTGNGNVAHELIDSLVKARARHIHIVRASRTGSGIVIRNAAQPDDRYGWIAADDQVPHKARILMMVALTGTRTTHALQEAFVTY
ncbi:asparaginase [Caballeronia sp. LP006]|jgi:glutamin-(asparagin-)ase|uniref:asparaginase n=1 Tax=unclassified Caballeronia TaxID=2646786 RepID=UPI001FD0278A|nr:MULTISPECIES: asparaginase [unclassified Caballeronia]MDR5827793.1 asparaginase [Caballeronia sp. LP006]